MIQNRSSIVLETVKDVFDEDWKTAIARGNPHIPAGTRVLLEKVVNNFYGRYYCVRYSGYLFYAKPSSFRHVEESEI